MSLTSQKEGECSYRQASIDDECDDFSPSMFVGQDILFVPGVL